MRIVVVGLGSMGRRRIRLLAGFFAGCEICGVDPNAQRAADAAAEYKIPCYTTLEQALAEFSPEVGFVCTSPLSHAGAISALLAAGIHVFTEINLVADGYAENQRLAAERGVVLFLSSTQLYRKEIVYIERAVAELNAPLAYRYHVGQYLPDWHPWENYRDFFVADKRTGGIREILAIEMPWLLRCFGSVVHFKSTATTLTSLALPYADTLLLTLEHESGACGQLLFELAARKSLRKFELVCELAYLRWGGTPDSLTSYDIEQQRDVPIECYAAVLQDPRYASNIVENAYVDEMAAFFELLAGGDVRRHTFEADAALLALLDEIEQGGAR